MNDIVWRGMTRDRLGAAYNNGLAFKDSERRLAGWEARTAKLRARSDPALLDLPYGPKPRNKIDLYRAGPQSAPLLVHVHGGYWQRNSKEVFGCMAEGPLAHGVDVAMVGYTLAPEASLTEIVGEVRAAMRWSRARSSSVMRMPIGSGRDSNAFQARNRWCGLTRVLSCPKCQARRARWRLIACNSCTTRRRSLGSSRSRVVLSAFDRARSRDAPFS